MVDRAQQWTDLSFFSARIPPRLGVNEPEVLRLLWALSYGDEGQQREAVEGLGQLEAPDSPLLEHPAWDRISVCAVVATLLIQGKGPGRQELGELLANIATPEVLVYLRQYTEYREARKAIGEFSRDPGAWLQRDLQGLWETIDPFVLAGALLGLGRSKRQLDALFSYLYDSRPAVCQAAIRAAGLAGSTLAIGHLEEMLRDNSGFKKDCIWALGEIRDPAAIPFLQEMLDHGWGFAKEWIIEAMGKIAQGSAEASAEASSSRDDNVEQTLAPLLDVLRLGEEDPEIALQASAGLAALAASAALDAGQRMSLLRELLGLGPHSWYALLWLLEQMPEAERDMVLPYAEAHLDEWEDAWRAVPWGWERWAFRSQLSLPLPPPLYHTPIPGALSMSLSRHISSQAPGNRDLIDLVRSLALRREGGWMRYGFVEALCHVPKTALASITSLDLAPEAHEFEHLKRLLSRADLRHLRHFCMRKSKWREAELVEILRLPALHGLQSLAFLYQPLNDAIAKALARSSRLRGLRRLSLAGGYGISDEGLSLLATSANLRGLSQLDISRNHIRAAGLEALLASPHFAALQHLILDDNRIGDKGAMILTQIPQAHDLRRLSVRNCGLSLEGLLELLSTPSLADTQIEAGRNDLDDEEQHALLEDFPQLSLA